MWSYHHGSSPGDWQPHGHLCGCGKRPFWTERLQAADHLQRLALCTSPWWRLPVVHQLLYRRRGSKSGPHCWACMSLAQIWSNEKFRRKRERGQACSIHMTTFMFCVRFGNVICPLDNVIILSGTFSMDWPCLDYVMASKFNGSHLACHPPLFPEWLDWVAVVYKLWRIHTGPDVIRSTFSIELSACQVRGLSSAPELRAFELSVWSEPKTPAVVWHLFSFLVLNYSFCMLSLYALQIIATHHCCRLLEFTMIGMHGVVVDKLSLLCLIDVSFHFCRSPSSRRCCSWKGPSCLSRHWARASATTRQRRLPRKPTPTNWPFDKRLCSSALSPRSSLTNGSVPRIWFDRSNDQNRENSSTNTLRFRCSFPLSPSENISFLPSSSSHIFFFFFSLYICSHDQRSVIIRDHKLADFPFFHTKDTTSVKQMYILCNEQKKKKGKRKREKIVQKYSMFLGVVQLTFRRSVYSQSDNFQAVGVHSSSSVLRTIGTPGVGGKWTKCLQWKWESFNLALCCSNYAALCHTTLGQQCYKEAL